MRLRDFGAVLTFADLTGAVGEPIEPAREHWTRETIKIAVHVHYRYAIAAPRSIVSIDSHAYAFGNPSSAAALYKSFTETTLAQAEESGARRLGTLVWGEASKCLVLVAEETWANDATLCEMPVQLLRRQRSVPVDASIRATGKRAVQILQKPRLDLWRREQHEDWQRSPEHPLHSGLNFVLERRDTCAMIRAEATVRVIDNQDTV